jgi:hypothetical protein
MQIANRRSAPSVAIAYVMPHAADVALCKGIFMFCMQTTLSGDVSVQLKKQAILNPVLIV